MGAKTIVPADNDELLEMLNDGPRMAAMFKAGAAGDVAPFQQWIKDYSRTFNKNDPSIHEQNADAQQKFMIEWLRQNESAGIRNANLNMNFDPNTSKRVGRHELYNNAAMGAKYDSEFTGSLSDFSYLLSDKSFKNATTAGLLERLRNDASSMKPSDGGFLIPERQRAEILRLSMENSIVRSRARVIPMDSLSVPFPTIDATSHASSIYGGIIGYWTEEGATLTESKPKFGRVVLLAHKLTLYIEVPNELLSDSSPSYGMFIDDMFPEALGWFEDIAFFNGGGVGEPLGIFNANCKITTTRTGASTVDYEEIVAMYARMLPSSLGRAVWVVAPDVLPELLTMVISGGTSPLWIGGAGGFTSAAGAPPMSLLGRPLLISEKAKALGTEGDISIVDFGSYLVGDRQAMTMRQSEDFRFNEDVTAFRATERLDGRPWLPSAITPQNGSSNTLSPIVTLGA